MEEVNKSTEDNNTDKKLNISDVMVSKTNNSIKLQLMSLYGTFGNKKKKNFKFY